MGTKVCFEQYMALCFVQRLRTNQNRCFAYWCTNGLAYLGESLDNKRYPKVEAEDLDSFLQRHKMEDLHIADRMIGL